MGQNPSDIRTEIEETRARVGDEVDALSYKTDVGARASDFVDDKKQAVKDKFVGVIDLVRMKAITLHAMRAGRQRPPLRHSARSLRARAPSACAPHASKDASLIRHPSARTR